MRLIYLVQAIMIYPVYVIERHVSAAQMAKNARDQCHSIVIVFISQKYTKLLYSI